MLVKTFKRSYEKTSRDITALVTVKFRRTKPYAYETLETYKWRHLSLLLTVLLYQLLFVKLLIQSSSSNKMADTAVATEAPAPATPAKKQARQAGGAGAAAKKPKAKPTHPKTSEMVNNAIKEMKERSGSSLQAIKKYIAAQYKVDAEKLAPFIRKYLKSAVESGALIQTKGKGASGSFKLESKSAASKKPAGAVGKAAGKAPAAAAKAKKATASAAGAKTKKAAAAAAAAAASPSKAKSSAASAAKDKKAAAAKKKPAPKKAAAPAKAKAPKAKKTAKPPTKKPKAPKPKKAASTPKKPAAKKASAAKK